MTVNNITDGIRTGDESEIIRFLSGKRIFITGATGFLGKVLIEKLLNNCNVDTIYTLVRAKKGKSSATRLNELFDSEMFATLTGDWRSKIKPVEGEMGIPDLGISVEMRKELIERVNIVFHCAATVRFDENLRRAVLINVQGTADVLSLCKRMKNLKSVVHVSTAFAHCTRTSIEEQFYTPGMDFKKALALPDTYDEKSVSLLEPRLLNGWPNTYTFTKAIAEDVVRVEGKDLPIAIFRPAIVLNTHDDCSVPGFIDNTYGPSGYVVGVGYGVLKSLYLPEKVPAHIVPANYCINIMLALAWKVGTQRAAEMPIYNFSVDRESANSFADMMRSSIIYGRTVPSIKCMWYNAVSITHNYWIHLLARFFLHIIPAFLIDIILKLLRQKTRAMHLCQKAHNLMDKVAYFAKTDWTFNCDNTLSMYASLNRADKEMFPFDMKNFDWVYYYTVMIDGIRLYLFKETPQNLEAARKRYLKLKILHYMIVYGFYTMVLYWLYTTIWQFSYPIAESHFKPMINVH